MVKNTGDREETYFYDNDHLGAPQVMTDQLQIIVWRADFDPFGNAVDCEMVWTRDDPSTFWNDLKCKAANIKDRDRDCRLDYHGGFRNTITNNLRFPGQYFDAETGLNYNYFRYYDPKTGRYTQTDPIGLTGGMNPYVYAGDNPARFIDPDGKLFMQIVAVVLVGAIVAELIVEALHPEENNEQYHIEPSEPNLLDPMKEGPTGPAEACD